MSYIIGLILCFFLYVEKKSKIIFSLAIIYACILFGLNYHNPDYYTYQSVYYGWKNSSAFVIAMEPGFKALCGFGDILGLGYQSFCFLVAALGLLLISLFFLRYSPYPNMALLMYLFYPFVIDVVQIRFFIAMSIVLNSIHFLYMYKLTEKRSNLLLFLLLIAIATAFHYSSIFYLCLIMVVFQPAKRIVGYYSLISLTLFATILSLPRVIPYVYSFMPLYIHKLNHWIGNVNVMSLIHFLRLLVTRGGFLILIYLANNSKRMLEYQKRDYKKLEQTSLKNEILLSSMLCIFFTNFSLETLMHNQFERISRLGLIVGYVLITRYAYELDIKQRRVIWSLCILFAVLYLSNIMFINEVAYHVSWFNAVFRNVFEHNLLFDQFNDIVSYSSNNCIWKGMS